MLRFRVEGAERLVIPSFSGRGRRDDLWKATCFELFLGSGDDGDGGYREFNFSPSGRWAVYDFSAYRAGQSDYEPLAWPDISEAAGSAIHICTVFLDARELLTFKRAGISAVIEEEGGHISYWALNHGDGKPDFHDPACFALELAPPIAP